MKNAAFSGGVAKRSEVPAINLRPIDHPSIVMLP